MLSDIKRRLFEYLRGMRYHRSREGDTFYKIAQGHYYVYDDEGRLDDERVRKVETALTKWNPADSEVDFYDPLYKDELNQDVIISLPIVDGIPLRSSEFLSTQDPALPEDRRLRNLVLQNYDVYTAETNNQLPNDSSLGMGVGIDADKVRRAVLALLRANLALIDPTSLNPESKGNPGSLDGGSASQAKTDGRHPSTELPAARDPVALPGTLQQIQYPLIEGIPLMRNLRTITVRLDPTDMVNDIVRRYYDVYMTDRSSDISDIDEEKADKVAALLLQRYPYLRARSQAARFQFPLRENILVKLPPVQGVPFWGVREQTAGVNTWFFTGLWLLGLMVGLAGLWWLQAEGAGFWLADILANRLTNLFSGNVFARLTDNLWDPHVLLAAIIATLVLILVLVLAVLWLVIPSKRARDDDHAMVAAQAACAKIAARQAADAQSVAEKAAALALRAAGPATNAHSAVEVAAKAAQDTAAQHATAEIAHTQAQNALKAAQEAMGAAERASKSGTRTRAAALQIKTVRDALSDAVRAAGAAAFQAERALRARIQSAQAYVRAAQVAVAAAEAAERANGRQVGKTGPALTIFVGVAVADIAATWASTAQQSAEHAARCTHLARQRATIAESQAATAPTIADAQSQAEAAATEAQEAAAQRAIAEVALAQAENALQTAETALTQAAEASKQHSLPQSQNPMKRAVTRVYNWICLRARSPRFQEPMRRATKRTDDARQAVKNAQTSLSTAQEDAGAAEEAARSAAEQARKKVAEIGRMHPAIGGEPSYDLPSWRWIIFHVALRVLPILIVWLLSTLVILLIIQPGGNDSGSSVAFRLMPSTLYRHLDDTWQLLMWGLAWTLFVLAAYGWRRPFGTTPFQRARFRYLVVWIGGLAVLLPVAFKLINPVVPFAASPVSQAIKLIPVFAVWSILVFLFYIYVGDGSRLHEYHIATHRAIWSATSFVLLITILTGYVSYQGIISRLEGHFSLLALARESLQDLHESTHDLWMVAHNIQSATLLATTSTVVPIGSPTADAPYARLDQDLKTARSRAGDAVSQTARAINYSAEEINQYLLDPSTPISLIPTVDPSQPEFSTTPSPLPPSPASTATPLLGGGEIAAPTTSTRSTAVALETTPPTTTTAATAGTAKSSPAVTPASFPTAAVTPEAVGVALLSGNAQAQLLTPAAALPAAVPNAPSDVLHDPIPGCPSTFYYRSTDRNTLEYLCSQYAALLQIHNVVRIAYQRLTVVNTTPASPVAGQSGGRDTFNRDLVDRAWDADTAVSTAIRSLEGISYSALPIFLWVGSLYSGLILVPWVLLLLFLYGKRAQLSAQILDDLIKLDPTGGKLALILSGSSRVRGPQEQRLQRLLETLQRTDDCRTAEDFKNRIGNQRADLMEALAERAFSDFEYLLGLLILSLLLVVGWYYVFYPQAGLGMTDLVSKGAGIRELVIYMLANLTPPTIAFVGAYFFLMQMLIRRYIASDLYPTAFLQAIQRLLLVFILSLAVGLVFPEFSLSATAGVVLATAFLIGMFPDAGLRLIITYVNRLVATHGWSKQNFFPETLIPEPIAKMTGITIWVESRLYEEGIENIQSLATAQIEQLIIRTHYAGTQIIDWVDQAILYLHCGHDGELFAQLRSVGIRSASDLLDNVGFDPEHAEESIASNSARYQDIAGAIQQNLDTIQRLVHQLAVQARGIEQQAEALQRVASKADVAPSDAYIFVGDVQAQAKDLQDTLIALSNAVINLPNAPEVARGAAEAQRAILRITQVPTWDSFSVTDAQRSVVECREALDEIQKRAPTIDPNAWNQVTDRLDKALSSAQALETTLQTGQLARNSHLILRDHLNGLLQAVLSLTGTYNKAYDAIQPLLDPAKGTLVNNLEWIGRSISQLRTQLDAVAVPLRLSGGAGAARSNGASSTAPGASALSSSGLGMLKDLVVKTRVIEDATAALAATVPDTAVSRVNADLLRVMSRALWPDPNILYIRNFWNNTRGPQRAGSQRHSVRQDQPSNSAPALTVAAKQTTCFRVRAFYLQFDRLTLTDSLKPTGLASAEIRNALNYAIDHDYVDSAPYHLQEALLCLQDRSRRPQRKQTEEILKAARDDANQPVPSSGRDLLEALKDGSLKLKEAIRFQPEGSNSSTDPLYWESNLTIENTGDQAVQVYLPVGTIFSNAKGVQLVGYALGICSLPATQGSSPPLNSVPSSPPPPATSPAVRSQSVRNCLNLDVVPLLDPASNKQAASGDARSSATQTREDNG